MIIDRLAIKAGTHHVQVFMSAHENLMDGDKTLVLFATTDVPYEQYRDWMSDINEALRDALLKTSPDELEERNWGWDGAVLPYTQLFRIVREYFSQMRSFSLPTETYNDMLLLASFNYAYRTASPVPVFVEKGETSLG